MTDLYRIEWKRSAAKELRNFPKNSIRKILSVIEQLSVNPFPAGARKLVGTEYMYRIRVGDYRIIYSIIKKTFVVEIIRIKHRKDVYQ